jgi:hypothetical protein
MGSELRMDFLNFAHRARCAAAILLRPARLIFLRLRTGLFPPLHTSKARKRCLQS